MEVFEAAEQTRERNTFEPEDIANINAFLREDVEWHGARDIPGVKGRDALIALAKQFKEATGGTLHLGMGSMFVDETHAASIVHLTATRPDKPDRKLDVMEVNLFHLDEHGKAFELWGVSADQDHIDAFWLPSSAGRRRLRDSSRLVSPSLSSGRVREPRDREASPARPDRSRLRSGRGGGGPGGVGSARPAFSESGSASPSVPLRPPGTRRSAVTFQPRVANVPVLASPTAETRRIVTRSKSASGASAHLNRWQLPGASTIHSADLVSAAGQLILRVAVQPRVALSRRRTTVPGTTSTDAEIRSPGRTLPGRL